MQVMALQVGNLKGQSIWDPGDAIAWNNHREYSTMLALNSSASQKVSIVLREGKDSYDIVNDGADEQLKVNC